MNQSDALLRTILEHPDDDLPRLCFADFLEESGDAARAEFIRVQVELARFPSLPAEVALSPKGIADHSEQRRREEELVRLKLFPTIKMPVLLERLVGQGNYRPDSFAVPHRGFISWLRCSWQDFIRIHESLIWSPTQTVECLVRVIADNHQQAATYAQTIAKLGNWFYGHTPHHFFGTSRDDTIYWVGTRQDRRLVDRLIEHGFTIKSVDSLRGTGRVPRPFVNTAQPLESVRLTTWPGGIPQPTYTGSFQIDGETRFDRVKCGTCDGWHLSRRVHECRECGGIDKNQWTCSRWPGVTFKMPEANTMAEFSREALRDIARGMTAPLDALGRAMHGIAESVAPALRSVADAWPRDADGNMIQFDGDGDVEG